MLIDVIIEMLKGDNRRRHLNYAKTDIIDLGLIKDKIPVNDGIMPIDYGYILNTLNKDEGDEIDVLIISDRKFKVGQQIQAIPFALIKRADKDDKVVAVDNQHLLHSNYKSWSDIEEDLRQLIEDFFSYHHKFIAIENKDITEEYIKKNITYA